jgi:hypothetical protein
MSSRLLAAAFAVLAFVTLGACDQKQEAPAPKKVEAPDAAKSGDAAGASDLGTTRPYTIANGKIVTMLSSTPIEIAVYRMGDKYVAARSNEFGYANYELIPAVEELSPLGASSRTPRR